MTREREIASVQNAGCLARLPFGASHLAFLPQVNGRRQYRTNGLGLHNAQIHRDPVCTSEAGRRASVFLLRKLFEVGVPEQKQPSINEVMFSFTDQLIESYVGNCWRVLVEKWAMCN